MWRQWPAQRGSQQSATCRQAAGAPAGALPCPASVSSGSQPWLQVLRLQATLMGTSPCALPHTRHTAPRAARHNTAALSGWHARAAAQGARSPRRSPSVALPCPEPALRRPLRRRRQLEPRGGISSSLLRPGRRGAAREQQQRRPRQHAGEPAAGGAACPDAGPRGAAHAAAGGGAPAAGQPVGLPARHTLLPALRSIPGTPLAGRRGAVRRGAVDVACSAAACTARHCRKLV